jgi:hypothetical protein
MTTGSRWHWRNWQAPALLGMGMAATWITQQSWVTALGVIAYLLVLLLDVLAGDERPSGREAVGLAVGAVAVAATALITTFWRPLPFPVNFLVSLGLGGAMQFGALNMLGPGTAHDLVDGASRAEYTALVGAMEEIAARLTATSRQADLPKATLRQLAEIASAVGLIASRHQQRQADFAGAATTLTILQQFDKILAHYLRIKSGQQFLDADTKRQEIAETEGRTIPMIQSALVTLGQQLDAGEVLDKKVAEDALESMLQSLNLIRDLKDHARPAPATAAPKTRRHNDDPPAHAG